MNLRSKKVMAIVIIAVALAAGLANIDRPRELWDERSRYMSGLAYWQNIIDGRFDAASWSLNSAHPPVAKYMYGLVNGAYLGLTNPSLLAAGADALWEIDMAKTMLPSRVLVLLLAIVIYLIVFVIGTELFNERVGFLASLILILLPPFAAHVRYSNLDMPMLFFFILSMLLLTRGMRSKSKNSRYVLLFGVSSGLCTSSLLSGGLVFIVAAAMFLMRGKVSSLKTPHVPRYLLISPLIAIVIFFALWPWLWSNPVGNIADSLGWWNHYYNAGTGQEEFFLGNFGPSPITYFLAYFAFTTPVLVAALAAISLLWLKRKEWYAEVLLWFVVVLAVITFIPTKLNGNTYILAAYPALALLAALGIEKIRSRFGNKAFVAAAAVTLVYLAASMASVHPFYIDYYNELSGGPLNVYDNKMFRIGAAGEGLDYAVDYINANAPINSSVEFHAAPLHVIRGLRPDIAQANPFFVEGQPSRASNFTPDYSFHDSDYIIENVYYKWYVNQSFSPEAMGYRLDYTVAAEGAPLAWVYGKQ
jgi:hypothetical protein